MGTDDITLEVLKGIRSELVALRGDFREQLGQLGESLGERIDQTNARLDGMEKRQREGETRLATEIMEVVHAITLLKDLLREGLDLRNQVALHETRIALLENRLGQ